MDIVKQDQHNLKIIEQAQKFATEKFEKAGRKNHFMDVFRILQDEFKISDIDVIVAGILHDTLEDTDTTYEELVSVFSKPIADFVQEVSHPKDYTPEQKIKYYEKIKTISSGAKFIKMADFTSHLRNFIKIYQRGEQSLYPKFTNNDKYIASIRDFLDSCNDSLGKQTVYSLANHLETLL